MPFTERVVEPTPAESPDSGRDWKILPSVKPEKGKNEKGPFEVTSD